jgi:hypothetical protein
MHAGGIFAGILKRGMLGTMTLSARCLRGLLLPLAWAVPLGGCATFQPRSVDQAALLRRAETHTEKGVTVSVVALTPEESRNVLGFPVALRGIQPVWVKVVNREPVRYYLPPITVDNAYFSPMEVAWQGHGVFTPATNTRIDHHLHHLGLPIFVEPGQTVAGFIFTHRDEGMKFASIELVGAGKQRVRRFSFLAQVPGIKTDFQKVDWDKLASTARTQDLSEDELRQWIEKTLPCCTLGGDRRTPADPLNIVLVGDRDTIFAPLARRGWHVTQALTVGSLWQTIHSSLFGSRYRYAPVSSLYVFNRRQDIALQKGREDVNQRNHMRLWLAPVTVNGTSVWVGQISRDIGVRLTAKTITTHKIDPSVDETRWYLLQDLFFSEGLERFGLLKGVGEAPFEQPRSNYTGDPYFTDGLRAVMWLTPRPVSYHRVATRWPAPSTTPVDLHGNGGDQRQDQRQQVSRPAALAR